MCVETADPAAAGFVAERASGLMVALLADAMGRLREMPSIAMAPRRQPALVEHVEALMRERLAEPLCVSEPADCAGVGRRTLDVAFHAVTGRSPRETLTALRLDAARAQPRNPGPGSTLTRVALVCGSGHFGRFSAA